MLAVGADFVDLTVIAGRHIKVAGGVERKVPNVLRAGIVIDGGAPRTVRRAGVRLLTASLSVIRSPPGMVTAPRSSRSSPCPCTGTGGSLVQGGESANRFRRNCRECCSRGRTGAPTNLQPEPMRELSV